MAKKLEVLAEQAIGVVASLPWHGQITDKVYTGKRSVSDGKDQIGLTAVWEGAGKLAGDPAVRCIVLEKNPNRRGLEDAVLLRVDSVDGKGSKRFSRVFLKAGVVPRIDDEGEEPLFRTILGNFTKLTVRP